MKPETLLAVIVGLLIGLAAGFLVFSAVGTVVPDSSANISVVPKAEANRLVLDWMTANEIPAVLVDSNEESGIYRITINTTTGVSGDVFVTRDGRFLFQSGVLVKNSTAYLIARRQFFDCLAAKDLKFYGSTEYNTTLMQLQALGGTQFVERIYVPCEGDSIQNCISANITEVPTFVYANATYSGVKTFDWFVNMTGCMLA